MDQLFQYLREAARAERDRSYADFTTWLARTATDPDHRLMSEAKVALRWLQGEYDRK